jgi:succinate dehydrogenase / fumarate reductase, membrane anchor subunit
MATVGKPLSARILAQASTRQGSHHWLMERVTSVALIPSYEEVRAWLATPFNTTAMLLLIFTTFWHAQLGVQVIIEDYTHHDITKIGGLMAANFALVALGLACVVAVLKVSFGS